MIIFAKDAEAGRRYKCVDTGDLIEICARPQDARNARLVPLTTEDGSFIHLNPVMAGNRRIRSADPSHPLAIPAFYRLVPHSWAARRGPSRRGVAPDPPKPAGRRGPPPKNPRWRGWAADCRADMEALLEAIEDEGLWVEEAFHHYKVGFGGKVCMAVYKAGQLGFRGRPDGALGPASPAQEARRDRLPGCCQWKIGFGVVMADGKWAEMLDMLRRHLKDFRRRSGRSNT